MYTYFTLFCSRFSLISCMICVTIVVHTIIIIRYDTSSNEQMERNPDTQKPLIYNVYIIITSTLIELIHSCIIDHSSQQLFTSTVFLSYFVKFIYCFCYRCWNKDFHLWLYKTSPQNVLCWSPIRLLHCWWTGQSGICWETALSLNTSHIIRNNISGFYFNPITKTLQKNIYIFGIPNSPKSSIHLLYCW